MQKEEEKLLQGTSLVYSENDKISKLIVDISEVDVLNPSITPSDQIWTIYVTKIEANKQNSVKN